MSLVGILLKYLCNFCKILGNSMWVFGYIERTYKLTEICKQMFIVQAVEEKGLRKTNREIHRNLTYLMFAIIFGYYFKLNVRDFYKKPYNDFKWQ